MPVEQHSRQDSLCNVLHNQKGGSDCAADK